MSVIILKNNIETNTSRYPEEANHVKAETRKVKNVKNEMGLVVTKW